MIDALSGLDVFVSVIDAGSISAAARELNIPRASLSRRLAELENRLGVRLLHRSTRKLKLSSAGKELEVRARHILADVKTAYEAVSRLDAAPRGLLRVSMPPTLEAGDTSDLISTFLDAWPDVEVELKATARYVDLVAEGIDVALRGGRDLDPGLIARILFRNRLIAVATPNFLAKHGGPDTVAELKNYECVRSFTRGSVPSQTWPLRRGGEIRVHGRLVTNDMGLHLRFASSGRAIAMIPDSLVSSAILEGRLVPVLEQEIGTEIIASAVYPEKEFLDPKVRAFVDHCVQWAEGKWMHQSNHWRPNPKARSQVR